MELVTDGGVRVVSRRMVLPLTPPPTVTRNGCHPAKEEAEVIHLTPWDLRLISIDYIQKGILLPNPPVSGDDLVNALQASFSRAFARFYPFAGQLASEEHGDGIVSVFLRCTSEGAEFVHAVALDVAAADIVSSLYTPPVVWAFYSLNEVLGADASIGQLPVLSVQVTELADGVFIGMTLNHSAGDSTAFWHFFNTWFEIHRRSFGGGGGIITGDHDLPDIADLSTPPPSLRLWFVETCPVPIPMPFSKLEHIVKPFERTTVQECFFTFSAASVKKLKAQANAEIAGAAMIFSLQAVLAHLWRAVCRARRLPPDQATFYSVVVGCWDRVGGIPAGYVGNDFGWGKPVAVRSGAGNKADGKAKVFEGPERGGSVSLEVCITPDALDRLVADQEFMRPVAAPNFGTIVSNDQTVTKCYTYASVPKEKIIMGPTPAGLGVFVRLPQGEVHRGVHVKAHVNDPTDSLHASTLARQLAAEICSSLNLKDVTFPRSVHKQTAQKLAKRARQSLPGQGCRFTCDNESHANSCLVLQALRNVHLEGFSFVSVHASD